MNAGAVTRLMLGACVLCRRDGRGTLRCIEVTAVRHGESAIVKGSHPVVVGTDVESRAKGLMYYPWQVVRVAAPGEVLIRELRGRAKREAAAGLRKAGAA